MNLLAPIYRSVEGFPVFWQDAVVLIVLLSPALLLAGVLLAGHRPLGLATGLIWRFRWTNMLFVGLIAFALGTGISLTSLERALREGSAKAADPFPLIVTAPGSEVTGLLAAVFLQPTDMPLISGEAYRRIADADGVSLAAPIAFGDSHGLSPVVGTTADFLRHLSPTLSEGRAFRSRAEAVAGSGSALLLGGTFQPAHGHGSSADHDGHAGTEFTVVGRLAPTGSPWDKAILIPVESIWEMHGLPNGHAPRNDMRLGPPFDAEFFPGTPAVLVGASGLGELYALRGAFNTAETMAFFPGGVLAGLHGLLGDVREVMSIIAAISQTLVAAAILAAMLILMRLMARRLALLEALGAPGRFVFAIVWGYVVILMAAGTLGSIAVAALATMALSTIVSSQADIAITATLGWPEFHQLAGFIGVAFVVAMIPAALTMRQSPLHSLRGY